MDQACSVALHVSHALVPAAVCLSQKHLLQGSQPPFAKLVMCVPHASSCAGFTAKVLFKFSHMLSL